MPGGTAGINQTFR